MGDSYLSHNGQHPETDVSPNGSNLPPRLPQWDGWSGRAVLLSYLLIGLTALLWRVLDPGIFVIGDEWGFWMRRSVRFLAALESGDVAATAISTHPGVTTMWLGSAGILVRRALLALGILHEETFVIKLALMQLPVMLTHTAGLLVSYTLLRRMLPTAVAALAAFIWATDPFIIGFDRVLHVDGLTGTFGMLSVLAACYALNYPHNQRKTPMLWLALSGMCGGLAVLSKSTGLVVVPIVGLLALRAWRTEHGAWSIGKLARYLLLWGTVYTATVVVVWPAVWAAPGRVYELFYVGIFVEGGSAHSKGNFFLGQDDPTPGPLFYPVALALRTTPWALAGLLLLPFATRPPRLTLRPAPATLRTLAALALLIILFVAGVTLFPKKLNRYLVPIFPAVDILAAVGLAWAAQHLAAVLPRAREQGRRIAAGLLAAVAVGAFANAAWFHPYGITYFNQALGGARTGRHTFLVGIGEGLEQVAAWLNQQRDITGVVTLTTNRYSLQPYLKDGAFAADSHDGHIPDNTGYVVVYVRNVWGNALPPFDQFYRQMPPVHVVTIHGVEYAWIYDVPRTLTHAIEADFAAAMQLHSYEVNTGALRTSGMMTVTTQWKTLAPFIGNDYRLFLHLFDANGQMVATVDVPPGGPSSPTSSWQQHEFILWKHPLPVAEEYTPGPGWLSIGLYDPATGTRLPVSGPPPPPGAPDDGPETLFLRPVVLP
jgi:4-amino-4-deoxy-L-arabinose transferase-like glycosyltransferase